MALLEDVVNFCKRELEIPQEILVSIAVEDISEDNVKGWTVDSAEDDEYDIEISSKTPDIRAEKIDLLIKEFKLGFDVSPSCCDLLARFLQSRINLSQLRLKRN